MGSMWIAITVVMSVLFVVGGIAHVVITLMVLRRYRWPFWFALNFAAFLMGLPVIKAVINFWDAEIEVATLNAIATSILVGMALLFGYLLQRAAMLAEKRIMEPDFQKTLTRIARVIAKGDDPWDYGSRNGIPCDTIQAAIHCYTSVEVSKRGQGFSDVNQCRNLRRIHQESGLQSRQSYRPPSTLPAARRYPGFPANNRG
ncbi:MAG: hypothetical protein AAF483_01485 [Planctomycetota bacterium]